VSGVQIPSRPFYFHKFYIRPSPISNMVSTDTQDPAEIHEGAINLGRFYWSQFFHLELEQQQGEIEKMVNLNILTTEATGHYQVQINIRGLRPAARNFEYGPDRLPAYFSNRESAQTLVDFCEGKGEATLEEYAIA